MGWLHNTRLHEDHVFGSLTLDCLDDDVFLLQYEGWKAHIHPHISNIEVIASGSIQKNYFMERIALPFLHLLRGCVLLHASAFSFNDKAFGLLAASGVGKSTLAAGFLSFPECRLIADDIVVLTDNSNAGLPVIQPISTQIAMRHGLFDGDDFVKKVEFSGYKRLLTLRNDKIQKCAIPLQSLIILNSGFICPPESVSFSEAIPVLLKQQMAISNPTVEFSRQQFHRMMALQNVPCFKMGISCKTRSDIESCCRQFFSLNDKKDEK